MSTSYGYYGEDGGEEVEMLMLSQMMSNVSTVDDEDDGDAEFLRNEQERLYSIANIDRLENKVITVKITKFRKRTAANARLIEEYFAAQPIYPAADFRRRFRMRRSLFNRILDAVCNYDPYFIQKSDATGLPGLSSHQKIIAALRHICYGACADIWGEHLAIGESTALKALKRFSNAILQVFGDEYLRTPTNADVEILTYENSRRGFPGMLGSIDCMHWKWKNCPIAWQGAYKGHKDGPTMILEAVASYDTWIWNAYFGMPGGNNDLNVMARSNIFEEMLHGRTPPMNFEVNGNQYNMGYYLADGIYPRYATIVKSTKNPTTNKEKLFSQAQEGVRKDVERAFGIIQARFAFLRQPARLWNKDALHTVMLSCIILHNMIVEDERRTDWPCVYDQIEELPNIQVNPTHVFNEYMGRRAKMTDVDTHKRLCKDLEEHIWSLHAAHRSDGI